MTLQELFELCDNIYGDTRIIVRSGYLETKVDEGRYVDMYAKYGEAKITGFRIDDRLHATIVIERGFDE